MSLSMTNRLDDNIGNTMAAILKYSSAFVKNSKKNCNVLVLLFF